jgi:Xaa-Pro aminopeptidase
VKTREKLEALRARMAEHGLTAYLVPSTDAHQSEYVPEFWRRRAWLSGFTGSAGECLVLRDQAGLWTDGRYFLQAERELRGSGIRLFRMGNPGVPTLHEFLARTLNRDDVLGADPRTLSVAEAKRLEGALKNPGASLRLLEENLVDAIWTDRPAPPPGPLVAHPVRFAGETVASKLRRLRKEMAVKRAHAHVLTSLDAVAWLYNLRGSDVAYMPVFLAYALVTADDAQLFVPMEKVTPAVSRALGKLVRVRPYEEFGAALGELAASGGRVWVDEGTCSRWLIDRLRGCDLLAEASPVALLKARKNETEIAGMRAAHVRDGVALVRFLSWLERELPKGGLTEISAADRLEAFRAEGENFRGLSFDTISGYAAHGAIIHYSVTAETDVPLRAEGIYLLDSGGQYADGTTDCTRTVLVGRAATREQKDRFTRVLRGHIALARARFPQGTSGIRLDTLARMALWEAGLDYNHGTGHGVGAYLGVHEGPQYIGTRAVTPPLEPGNILSNEPGFYVDGSYGLRIENLILVVEDKEFTRPERRWLRFETLTLCPIDTRLVEARLLAAAERKWLDDYHRSVWKTLSPHLDAAEKAWLRRACAPLR